MKFGQLIEYSKRNIFKKKSHTQCGGETVRRHFYEILKLSISGSEVKSFIQFVFIIVCQIKTYQNILKLRSRSLVFISHICISVSLRGVEGDLGESVNKGKFVMKILFQII